ncbi:hypothetical protein BH11PSE14_BH11PSE14_15270 [soil metagenome]
MTNAPVIVLVLAGLGFAGFGLWLLIDPAGGLGAVNIAATGPAGLIELRAFYGGWELGLGAFLLACAMKPEWREAGLWLVLLANGGTGLARVVGISLAGFFFTPFLIGALVWEFGFAIAAALALRTL